MDPSSSWQLIILAIVVILIVISAIVTLAETAFVNLSKGKIRNLVEDEVKNAKTLSDLLENESIYSTLVIGNSLLNVSAAILGAYLLTVNLNIQNLALKLFISIFIMTFLILIFGEIIPDTVARKYPEKVALANVTLAKIFLILLRPLVVIFYGFSNLILKIFGFKRKKEPQITMEELKNLVDVSVEEGVLDETEKEIIENITEFGEIRVDSVMTQRYDMIAVDSETTFDEIKKIILEEKYSRIPVYRDSTDNILGILNIKDLMFIENTSDFKLVDYLRPAYFTYEFKLVQELFREMRKERTHMAIVLDEYGGTVGLVTIEDLLEEIVGEIEDEFDDETEVEFRKIKENEYYALGSYKLEDLNEELGTKIESDEVDTIGGFIIDLLGNFPENHQEVIYENLKFIVDFAKNRITGVKILVGEKEE